MHMVAPAPITSENAREMSLKGWEIRNAEKQRLLNDSAELAKLKAELAERPLESDRAKRLGKQMDAIEKAMRGAEGKLPDAKDLANYTAAHARLFSAWQVLTGTQNPGVRKNTKRRESSNVQPLPQPEVSRNTDATPTTGPRSEDCNG